MFSVLFPGQGSQSVGMAANLYNSYSYVKELFEIADETLGFSLSKLILEGPKEQLDQTENTQPAIFLASTSIFEMTKRESDIDLTKAKYFAGHSLGEYSALAVAGVLSISDAVTLVLERGRLMQGACNERPGGMAALIGLDEVTAEEICRESGAQMSTINTEQQIILAGDHHSLAMAIDMASARGAKKAIPLQVGGAFHSGLMSPAQNGLNAMIDSLTFYDPLVPLVGNVTAKSLGTADEVKEELRLQLTSCVQWNNTVKFMLNDGIDTFYEIGHGKILSGMVKRIDSSASITSIGDFASVLNYASAS
jgi:[acyl-carrier-protein] S-malonyltransferase